MSPANAPCVVGEDAVVHRDAALVRDVHATVGELALVPIICGESPAEDISLGADDYVGLGPPQRPTIPNSTAVKMRPMLRPPRVALSVCSQP